MGNDVVDVGLAVFTGGASLLVTQPMRMQEKMEERQRESQRIQRASQQVKDVEERRKMARQERIRRARIEQSAVNMGAQGSSGEMGAVSALATNTSGAMAQMSGQQQTADQLTELNQQIAGIQSNLNLFNTATNLALNATKMVAGG